MSAPRNATPAEVRSICQAMTSHYGARFFWDHEEWIAAGNYDYYVTPDDIIVRDEFISDGPGFTGSIAWVQFGGGPECCCILSHPDTSTSPNRHGWVWDVVTLEASP